MIGAWAAAAGQRVNEPPQRTRSGEDVRLRKRALREPDRIKSCQQRGPERDRAYSNQAHREPPHGQQAKRGHHQHGFARDRRKIAGRLPPQCEVDAWQWWMSVAERSSRDERTGAEK